MSTPAVVGLRTTSARRLGSGDATPRLGWAVQDATEARAYRVQVGGDEGFTDLLGETEGEGYPSWVD